MSMLVATSFKIKSISIATYDTSLGGYPYRVRVAVDVDASYWKKLAKKKDLGSLYGVDIGNAVYKLSNRLVPSYNPSVNDTKRVKAGVKTVELFYYLSDHALAEKLGLKVLRMRSGECVAPYGGHAMIYQE